MKLTALLIAAWLAAAAPSLRAEDHQAEVIALLTAHDYAALDSRLLQVQQDFERGALTEYELRDAFKPFETLRNPKALDDLREWAKQSPQSYSAHLALGLNYRARGNAARGHQFWEASSPEQRDGLIRNFTQAEPELRRSLQLTAKPYLSLLNLMVLAGHMEARPTLEALLLQADEALPDNQQARVAYARYQLPRWGGTYEAFDGFVARSEREGVEPATLLKLRALGLNDRGQTLLADHHRAEAEALFRQALLAAQQAGDEGNFRANNLAASVKHICKAAENDSVCQPPASAIARAPSPSRPAQSSPLGLDMDHPVIITAARSPEAVSTEHAWLGLRYPGAALTKQALIPHAGRLYDAMSITTEAGAALTLYFDVTALSGLSLK